MDGYVRRQQAAIDRAARDEAVALPADLDYAAIRGALARGAREARPRAAPHARRRGANPGDHPIRHRAGERPRAPARRTPVASRRRRVSAQRSRTPRRSARCADAGIDDALAERLAVYAALVLDANRRLNLTGREDGRAFAAHIVDALTLRATSRGPLIDVGSGNGLPGIPLALATGARVACSSPSRSRRVFLAARRGGARAGRRRRSPRAPKTPPAIRPIARRFRPRRRGPSRPRRPSRS